MTSVKLVGHDEKELQKDVQDPHRHESRRRALTHGVQLPAGHHRQHPRGVQHRPDVGDRLRAALGAPTGRYIAPASDAELHRRSTAATAARRDSHPARPAVLALATCASRSVPARRRRRRRARLRGAERVRQHQLQPLGGPNPGTGTDTFQVTSRLHRHQHHVRSGRPHRPARLAHQLVRHESIG